MKKSLLSRIGAGFLMGSVLAVVPVGVASAADLYDSLQQSSDAMQQHKYRSGSDDMYNAMEPTAAGPQGPVRTDMMKDAGAYYGSERTYDTSRWSAWDELRSHLGPVGGEGTN